MACFSHCHEYHHHRTLQINNSLIYFLGASDEVGNFTNASALPIAPSGTLENALFPFWTFFIDSIKRMH